MFIWLDKTPERDGQTDGQTDSPWLLQRSAIASYADTLQK